MKKRHLWHTLLDYSIGGSQHLLFVEKLQQQTGWHKVFCRQAIEEYRRFLYLATISEQAISPSKVVDTVWHLHLTFSRCYWQNLCPNILKKSLHHDPAEASNTTIMAAQFDHTLKLYKDEFQQTPPEPIWHGSIQPSKKTYRRRVQTITLTIGLAFLAGMSFAAETIDNATDSIDWIAILLLAGGVYIVFKVISGLTSSKKKGRRGGGSGSSGGSDCSSDCSSSCSSGSSCGGGD